MTWPDGGMTPFHGEKGSTWEGGESAAACQLAWKIPAGKVHNGMFDGMDWLPTLVEAAGGPSDLKEQMLTGYEGYKAHLDGYNQMSMLTEQGPSNRKEIIYYERDRLQAVRVGDWKAHFVCKITAGADQKKSLTRHCCLIFDETLTSELQKNPGCTLTGWVKKCGHLVLRKLRLSSTWRPSKSGHH